MYFVVVATIGVPTVLLMVVTPTTANASTILMMELLSVNDNDKNNNNIKYAEVNIIDIFVFLVRGGGDISSQARCF